MLDAAIVDQVMATAVVPTLELLRDRGIDYRGVLYAGMMLTAEGPKLLEYNVRFGDPECQVVLPRLTSDVGVLLRSAAAGEPLDVTFGDDACVTVVLATEGYPASPRTGDEIRGLDAAPPSEAVMIFHAGTTTGPGGALVTAGGRVLDVTAIGPTIAAARARAYAAAGQIDWPGMQYRRDIASAAASLDPSRGAASSSAPGS